MTRFILALVLLVSFASPAHADDLTKARQFVNELADKVIHILVNEKTRAKRERAFDMLFTEHANMRRIARFTLGPYARTISNADFVRFQSLLQELVVRVYANRLGEYSNEKLVILKEHAKGRNFIISSQIRFTTGRAPIDVDWWVIREKNGGFTLFDLRVLGIWLAQEQRDVFSAVLQSNNGDVELLLKHLQEQITPTTQN